MIKIEIGMEGNFVICYLCKKKMKHITNTHLKFMHKMSSLEYKKNFPDVEIISKATSEKYSLVRKGKNKTDQAKKNMSIGKLKYYAGLNEDEHRKIIEKCVKASMAAALISKGKKQDSDFVIRRTKNLKGQKRTLEQKQNMSNAQIGLKRTEKAKKNMSLACLGKKQTPEHAQRSRENLLKKYYPTKIEQKLYSVLNSLDVEFKPQFAFEKYIVDAFVPSINMIIECNGCYWHGCTECGYHTTKEQTDYALQRRGFFQSHGYSVVYLWGHDLHGDDSSIVDILKMHKIL